MGGSAARPRSVFISAQGDFLAGGSGGVDSLQDLGYYQCLLRQYGQRLALHHGGIHHPVKIQHGAVKRGALYVAALLAKLQLLRAICRLAALVLNELCLHGSLGINRKIGDIFELVIRVGGTVGAIAAAEFEHKISCIGIHAVDLYVHNGLVGGSEDDFCIVVTVAAGEDTAEGGECDAGILVPAQECQRLTHGMGARVVQTSGALALQGLPVPTARKARIFEAYLYNVTKLTARNYALNVFESRGEGYFRSVEAQVIAEISIRNGLVIATGGGAVLRQDNVSNLHKNSVVFLCFFTGLGNSNFS
mgnify:CR=1 FL=1